MSTPVERGRKTWKEKALGSKRTANATSLPTSWKLWLPTGHSLVSFLMAYSSFSFSSFLQILPPLLSFWSPFLFQASGCQFWLWSSPHWLFLAFATRLPASRCSPLASVTFQGCRCTAQKIYLLQHSKNSHRDLRHYWHGLTFLTMEESQKCIKEVCFRSSYPLILVNGCGCVESFVS